MKTEKKLYTQKAKLFKKLVDTLWEGKELTCYYGIGIVNMMDNKKFLDTLDMIQANNYIEDVSDQQFTRNNKLMDNMTIDKIEKEIAKYERVVKIYRDMPEANRKALAIGTMIKHYESFVNKYEQQFETKKEAYLLEIINELKEKIDNLYFKLVA